MVDSKNITNIIVLALDYTNKGLLDEPGILVYDFILDEVKVLDRLGHAFRDMLYVSKNKEVVEAWERGGLSALTETSLTKIGREPHTLIWVKYIEKGGVLYSYRYNTRLGQLVTSGVAVADQELYKAHKRNLLVMRERSTLLKLNESGAIASITPLDSVKTNTSDKWLSKSGSALVYNADVNVNYVFTDVNNTPCYTSLSTVSKFLGSGVYPLDYADTGLKVLSGGYEKGKKANSIKVLNLGYTSAEDLDANFYLMNEGVPMLKGNFFNQEVYQDRRAEAQKKNEELYTVNLDTDGLALFGSDAKVETPITDSTGNLCGYSKDKVSVCNLFGVKRIDSDLILSGVEYRGIAINDSLISVKAKELGIDGFSSNKLLLLVNGTEPDVVLGLVGAMDDYRLTKGLFIVVSMENTTVDSLSNLVSKLKYSKLEACIVKVVDRFYTAIGKSSDELDWMLEVNGVSYSMLDGDSNTERPELLTVIIDKKSTASSIKMVNNDSERSLKLQEAVNKGLIELQGCELNKYDTVSVNFTVDLSTNKNALVEKQNKDGNRVKIARNRRYALLGYGNMKLADAIVAGYTDFIYVNDGAPIYFALSSITRLKAGLSFIEHIRQDLLSAYANACVLGKDEGSWGVCAGQLIQLDAQLNGVTRAITEEVLKRVAVGEQGEFVMSVDIWGNK